MAKRPDPVAPADDEGRALAHRLLRANHAALAYLDAESHAPGISRIAFGLSATGHPMTLISALAPHFEGLQACADCAVMLADEATKGDPLTHPRLMIRAQARFIAPDDPDRAQMRDHWLASHPKSALYIDFADFAFVVLSPVSGLLNGGFARAYRLSAQDLMM